MEQEEKMGVGFTGQKAIGLALAGAMCLALIVVPARAQDVVWGRKSCPPCPPCLPPAEKPALDVTQPTPSPAQPPTQPLLTPERAAAFEGETVALAAPTMIGDLLAPSCGMRSVTTFVQGPSIFVPGTPGTPAVQGIPGVAIVNPSTGQITQITTQPTPGTPATPGTPGFTIPSAPVPVTTTIFVPSESHSFKIADNESPRPQDRVINTFNFFNFVEGQANARIGANVGNVNFYREIIGFEKTFFDGYASIGMRLPFDLLDIGGNTNMDSADVGDLSIIFKAILFEDRQMNYLFSGGLVVTVPTGPTALGGPGFTLDTFNSTLLQPFIGFLWTPGNFYLHGFSSIDVPTDPNDVTFLFNDLGIGYFVFRNGGGEPDGVSLRSFITAIAPTIEVHVNDPLNHRHPSADCILGLPDWVDITGGVTFEFNRRASLAIGVSAPVTGPKPYALEAISHLNIRF